jgi:hypothetical protein
METQFTMPGFSEMMEQVTAIQKNSIEIAIKTVEKAMGENNPLSLFCFGSAMDNPVIAGCSEFMDIMQNAVKGMLGISELFIPVLNGNGNGNTNPLSFMNQNMTELPARIIQKLLEIPPVGITRPYQEKINHALNKMTMFHTAAMDFLYCTFLPVEEATVITFKEMVKQAETLKSPEDMKKIYDQWIKTLEHEYQGLFKTDRYKTVIARIFNAMGEFRAATRELTLDLVHLSGLPGGKEVDELCKDMFAVKKKMKGFEKQLKQLSESATH